MQRQIAIVILLTGFCLAGCATSGASKNTNSLTTSLIRSNFHYDSGGLAGDIPIFYQVQIDCKNERCNKPRILLSFSVSPGAQDVSLNNFELAINAGKKRYHWGVPRGERSVLHVRAVAGKFLSVYLTEAQLKQIANNKKVRGTLAGIKFKWLYRNRKPLRLLLKKLNHRKAIN